MLGGKRAVAEMPADAASAAGGGESYGGFWIRLLAYWVDGAILFIALILLAVLAAFLGEIGAVIFALFNFLGPFLYFAVMESSARQATFGKQLVGLQVAHAATGERISFLRALGRELAKILSGLILMIGFIMAAFTGRKQGLHDMVASTVVVRARPGHVVAALVVVVAMIVLPFFVLPLLVGLLAGGAALGMLGFMMGDAAKQAQKDAKPKPSVSQPATKPAEKPRPPVSTAPPPPPPPAKPAEPAKPATVEVKPQPPAPAPAKPATAEVKPAAPAKPAAAAPAPAQPAQKPAVVAAAPTPPPAPVMKAAPAPKPAPAAAPASDERPKVVYRARKPAAPPPAAAPAPAPVTRTPKYNDVMTAVMVGDRAAVADLIEMGFWVDRPATGGETALMAAAQRGDAAMTQVLLKGGANPNRTGPGGSALDYARAGGNSKVVALIQQAGGR